MHDSLVETFPNIPKGYFNGKHEHVTSFLQKFLDENDDRVSSYSSYLKPILEGSIERENLAILCNSFVEKILIDDGRKAYAVRVNINGSIEEIRADKEIILSSGVINSPQVLMLSGIGPANHLKQMGIQVIADLPVGLNLHDHFTPLGILGSVNVSSPKVQNIDAKTKHARMKPFNEISCSRVESSFRNVKGNIEFANVRICLHDYEDNSRVRTHINNKYFNSYFHNNNNTFVTVDIDIEKPKSRGKLYLTSTNPYEYPAIDPKYLSHEDDLLATVEAMKLGYKILQSKALNKYGCHVIPNISIPICDEYFDINSNNGFMIPNDDYLKCVAKNLIMTGYHPVGTCRMGENEDDPLAVVDSKLNVIGITGLRAIDGSVIPQVISGNTRTPILMIAEKGSDMIKNDWIDN